MCLWRVFFHLSLLACCSIKARFFSNIHGLQLYRWEGTKIAVLNRPYVGLTSTENKIATVTYMYMLCTILWVMILLYFLSYGRTIQGLQCYLDHSTRVTKQENPPVHDIFLKPAENCELLWFICSNNFPNNIPLPSHPFEPKNNLKTSQKISQSETFCLRLHHDTFFLWPCDPWLTRSVWPVSQDTSLDARVLADCSQESSRARRLRGEKKNFSNKLESEWRWQHLHHPDGLDLSPPVFLREKNEENASSSGTIFSRHFSLSVAIFCFLDNRVASFSSPRSQRCTMHDGCVVTCVCAVLVVCVVLEEAQWHVDSRSIAVRRLFENQWKPGYLRHDFWCWAITVEKVQSFCNHLAIDRILQIRSVARKLQSKLPLEISR